MNKNTSKYTNHTIDEIEKYLEKVKKSVEIDKFIICTTEKNIKNRKFIEKYKLDKSKQKQMLMQLEAKDFCYSADDYNNPKERLYIFFREYELNNWGTIERIKVYFKLTKKKNDFIVVISFHEPEKEIKKLFL